LFVSYSRNKIWIVRAEYSSPLTQKSSTESVHYKMAVFWEVAPCSLVDVYRRFRGTCCLHHQGDESCHCLKQLYFSIFKRHFKFSLLCHLFIFDHHSISSTAVVYWVEEGATTYWVSPQQVTRLSLVSLKNKKKVASSGLSDWLLQLLPSF
jgi:hypothetical protein